MSDIIPFPAPVRAFIDSTTWTFAKTMPLWPHEYLVRGRVDEAMFVAIMCHIREHGYEGKFYRRSITYFDDRGMVYWTMGAPIETETIINRTLKENSYESRLRNGTLPEQLAKKRSASDVIGPAPLTGADVRA